MAVKGAVDGIPAGQQGGEDLGQKPLPVHIAPGLGQTLGGALLGLQKEVVHVHKGAGQPLGQLSGQGGLAAGAPAVDGQKGPAVPFQQRRSLAENGLQGTVRIVIFHI